MVAAAERAYVALGSNLGDRARHLAAAREALAKLPETEVLAASAVEETAPLAGMQQPPYLNQMVLLDRAIWAAARDGARPYHSPSRAAQPRLLAARAGGAASP